MGSAVKVLVTVVAFLVIINMILFGLMLIRNAFVREEPANWFDWLPFRERDQAFPWTWRPNETESIMKGRPARP